MLWREKCEISLIFGLVKMKMNCQSCQSCSWGKMWYSSIWLFGADEEDLDTGPVVLNVIEVPPKIANLSFYPDISLYYPVWKDCTPEFFLSFNIFLKNTQFESPPLSQQYSLAEFRDGSVILNGRTHETENWSFQAKYKMITCWHMFLVIEYTFAI